eukprot:4101812-Prymnesium_polylepis.2
MASSVALAVVASAMHVDGRRLRIRVVLVSCTYVRTLRGPLVVKTPRGDWCRSPSPLSHQPLTESLVTLLCSLERGAERDSRPGADGGRCAPTLERVAPRAAIADFGMDRPR